VSGGRIGAVSGCATFARGIRGSAGAVTLDVYPERGGGRHLACIRPEKMRETRLHASDGKGTAMPTFVLLSTLTPEGVQTIKNNPTRIREVNKEVEQLGATVKAQWATLGRFDFVNIVEAPDEQTIARVSLELGSRGTSKYETLVAIPVDDFIAAL
jgi:uncharacterized protein with GYD domain